MVTKMKKIIIITFKVLLSSILLFILFFVLVTYYQTKMTEINHREMSLKSNINKKFDKTKFIFIFSDHNKSVEDIHNQVNKIMYTDGDEIDIKILNKVRMIYIIGGAGLKTSNDSFGAGKDFAKLKGYMGIWDKEHTKFYVDNNGKFDAIEYRNKK